MAIGVLSGKESCKSTEFKRWSATEIHWNKYKVSWIIWNTAQSGVYLRKKWSRWRAKPAKVVDSDGLDSVGWGQAGIFVQFPVSSQVGDHGRNCKRGNPSHPRAQTSHSHWISENSELVILKTADLRRSSNIWRPWFSVDGEQRIRYKTLGALNDTNEGILSKLIFVAAFFYMP